MIQRAKNVAKPKGAKPSKSQTNPKGTPPDGDLEHGFCIGSYTPIATPLDTPEQVDLFRRTVNTESELFFLVATRSTREMARKHLEWRVGQITGELNLALYKFGMLDCALCAHDPDFGLRWIAESLPVLEKSPVLEPFASYFYMRAGSFATLKGRWDLCRKYVQKGIKLLPKDPSKVLWASELHRLLAVFYLQQGKCKSAKDSFMKATDLISAHGDNYPPALLIRNLETAGALFRTAGDLNAELEMEALRLKVERGFHRDQLCQNRAELRMEHNVLK